MHPHVRLPAFPSGSPRCRYSSTGSTTSPEKWSPAWLVFTLIRSLMRIASSVPRRHRERDGRGRLRRRGSCRGSSCQRLSRSADRRSHRLPTGVDRRNHRIGAVRCRSGSGRRQQRGTPAAAGRLPAAARLSSPYLRSCRCIGFVVRYWWKQPGPWRSPAPSVPCSRSL